eukprot:g14339.t1
MVMRRHFFTHRAVSLWNTLPKEVVDAKMNVFKRRLDIAPGVNEIKGYGEKAGLGYRVGRSATIVKNGRAGSKGRMASSCSYL